MRRDFSVPILEQFHAWLVEQRDQVLPKSPMAEAIGYALNNWTGRGTASALRGSPYGHDVCSMAAKEMSAHA